MKRREFCRGALASLAAAVAAPFVPCAAPCAITISVMTKSLSPEWSALNLIDARAPITDHELAWLNEMREAPEQSEVK